MVVTRPSELWPVSDEAAHAVSANRTKRVFPRYRVEEHVLDQAAFIVGFADTPLQVRTLLALRAAQLTRAGSSAELLVIDQDTEAVLARRQVCVTPTSPGIA
jgi:hypothetical protein